jgi:hypothetical protein
MLYLAMIDITKKWTATARTGARSIPSWIFILKNAYLARIYKEDFKGAALTERDKIPCIIQTGRTRKPALPVCNYS